MFGMLGVLIDYLHSLGIVSAVSGKGGLVSQDKHIHILFQPLQIIHRFVGEHEDAVLCQVDVNRIALSQHGKDHVEQDDHHQKGHREGGGEAAVSQLAVR